MPRGKPKFDFDIDCSFIDVEDMLDTLEIKSTISHENATFLCPFHHEVKPSARMSARTTAWLCNGCGEKGKNAISFFAKLRGISMSESKRMLEERYGGMLIAALDNLEEEVTRNLNSVEHKPEKRIAPTEEWVEMFFSALWSDDVWSDGIPEAVMQSRGYILGRGFSMDTLTSWCIGYDWHSNRLAIPVRDGAGKLIGFKGRAWEPERHPKYLVIGDSPNPNAKSRYNFQTYRKSEVVFGLDRCEPYPDRMIVVEGELNVLAMKEHGWENVVAVAGAEFSATQAQLIIERAEGEVIVFFDDNSANVRRAAEEGRQGIDAGLQGSVKLVHAISPHRLVRVVLNAPGDANELDEDVVDELITKARPSLELQVQGILPRLIC
jgi:DNA primase